MTSEIEKKLVWKHAIDVLNPKLYDDSGISRWKRLADKCCMSEKKIIDIMLETNQLDVISRIDEFLESLIDLQEQYVYIGITTGIDEKRRIAEHSRIHGTLQSIRLNEYSSRFDGSLAEALGIQYLKRISMKFKKVLNVSIGYENYNAKEISEHMILYAYSTKTPNYNIESGILKNGLMGRPNRPQERVEGKVWCLQCQKSLGDDFQVAFHNKNHGRKNVLCDICNIKTVTENAMKYHQKAAHDLSFHCFKSGCNFVGTLDQFRGKHFKECFPRMFDSSNIIVQKILNDPNYEI